MSPFKYASDRDAGVLFDFNGVLFWDSHLQEMAWSELAIEVRGTPFTDDEMLHQVHGRTTPNNLEYMLGRLPSDRELADLSDRKEQAYRRICLARGACVLSPGATALLDTLAEASIPFTIATSSPRSNVDFYIEQFALERWFDVNLIVYDDGTFPGKPAPDPYQRAAKTLGLVPSDCAVVEDAVSGIEAARRAGVGEIIALGPEEQHRALGVLPGVSSVITRLDELEARFLSLRTAPVARELSTVRPS